MAKIPWPALSSLWMLVAATVSAGTVMYVLLFFLVNPTPWNFPGEPPVFEFLAFGSVAAVLVNVPLWLLSKLVAQDSKLVETVSSVGSIVSAAVLLIASLGILERQDSRWSEIRNGIRHSGDAIAAAAGGRDRVLSPTEFERFRQEFLPTPIVVQLRGYGPVHLRMADDVYPFVGVDFSASKHMLFDPRTMLCR